MGHYSKYRRVIAAIPCLDIGAPIVCRVHLMSIVYMVYNRWPRWRRVHINTSDVLLQKLAFNIVLLLDSGQMIMLLARHHCNWQRMAGNTICTLGQITIHKRINWIVMSLLDLIHSSSRASDAHFPLHTPAM